MDSGLSCLNRKTIFWILPNIFQYCPVSWCVSTWKPSRKPFFLLIFKTQFWKKTKKGNITSWVVLFDFYIHLLRWERFLPSAMARMWNRGRCSCQRKIQFIIPITFKLYGNNRIRKTVANCGQQYKEFWWEV